MWGVGKMCKVGCSVVAVVVVTGGVVATMSEPVRNEVGKGVSATVTQAISAMVVGSV